MFAWRPVSTKVMFQSSMSLFSSVRSSPALRQGEVVGDPLLVVEEELLDDVGLVAQAEDEVLVAVVRVVLHQMPEDRPVADLDHRLRDLAGELPEPSAEPAAEQHHLHRATPPFGSAGTGRRPNPGRPTRRATSVPRPPGRRAGAGPDQCPVPPGPACPFLIADTHRLRRAGAGGDPAIGHDRRLFSGHRPNSP